ncbi:hypothetical protein [Nostoc sp. UHCC 0302]
MIILSLWLALTLTLATFSVCLGNISRKSASRSEILTRFQTLNDVVD